MATSAKKYFFRAWLRDPALSVNFWAERGRAEWTARVLLKVDETRPVRVEEIPEW